MSERLSTIQRLFILAILAMLIYAGLQGLIRWVLPVPHEPYIKALRWIVGMVFILLALLSYRSRKNR